MKKLLPLLLSLALATPVFAADAAKPAAPAAPAQVKAPAVGEVVTPAGNDASMKEIIAKAKVDSDAAKAKAAGGKK